MINFPILWHPKFRHVALKNQGALLLSESSEYFIEENEYRELCELVKRKARLHDYLYPTKASGLLIAQSTNNPVDKLKKLEKLIESRVLCPSIEEYTASNKYYQTPNSDAPWKYTRVGECDVYDLGVFPTASQSDTHIKELIHTLPSSSTNEPYAIVIIDDYLDPRLLSLHNTLKKRNTSWLIIKTSGEFAHLGPYFSKHQNNKACIHCLQTRLFRNKPVREWLRRYQSTNVSNNACKNYFTEIPTLSPEVNWTRVTDNFCKIIKHDNTFYSDTFIYRYTPNSKVHTQHHIKRNLLCLSCGEPNKRLPCTPIQLSDAQKHVDTDGGYRETEREDTLAKLKLLIDPICGVINELTPLSIEPNNKMSVYRASYFQNSYLRDHIDPDTFVQLALGKGISHTQAQVSALGEALERQAAQYTGEESIVFSRIKDLPGKAYTPQELSPFSNKQYQEFKTRTRISIENPQWVKPFTINTPIHWQRAWSLSSHKVCYIPAAYCFTNTPFADQVYSLYHHNGNAAGNTKEEAILQGTFEVIERDAVAIWWYNQIPRPAINLDIIPEDQRTVISNSLDAQWHYWVLDVTTDINIPCCVAVGQHKETQQFALGFGCHIAPEIACSRALTEMQQLIKIRDKVTGPFDFDTIEALPYLYPKNKTLPKSIKDFPLINNKSIKDDILYTLEMLMQTHLDLCVVDYSRQDLPLKTLKVIVPGLCHFWPQLANIRLYDTPVKLGWLSKPLREDERNPLDLYL